MWSLCLCISSAAIMMILSVLLIAQYQHERFHGTVACLPSVYEQEQLLRALIRWCEQCRKHNIKTWLTGETAMAARTRRNMFPWQRTLQVAYCLDPSVVLAPPDNIQSQAVKIVPKLHSCKLGFVTHLLRDDSDIPQSAFVHVPRLALFERILVPLRKSDPCPRQLCAQYNNQNYVFPCISCLHARNMRAARGAFSELLNEYCALSPGLAHHRLCRQL